MRERPFVFENGKKRYLGRREHRRYNHTERKREKRELHARGWWDGTEWLLTPLVLFVLLGLVMVLVAIVVATLSVVGVLP